MTVSLGSKRGFDVPSHRAVAKLLGTPAASLSGKSTDKGITRNKFADLLGLQGGNGNALINSSLVQGANLALQKTVRNLAMTQTASTTVVTWSRPSFDSSVPLIYEVRGSTNSNADVSTLSPFTTNHATTSFTINSGTIRRVWVRPRPAWGRNDAPFVTISNLLPAAIDAMISAVSTSIQEGGSTILTVTIDSMDSYYDGTPTYAWSLSGLGSLSATNIFGVTFTAPSSGAEDTVTTITCVVSVVGTGTNAQENTQASITLTQDIAIGPVVNSPRPITFPDDPVTFTYVPASNQYRPTVTWNAPVVDANNDAATGYYWRMRDRPAGATSGVWSGSVPTSSTQPNTTLTTVSGTLVDPGDFVNFQVWAHNLGGYASFRGTGEVQSPTTPPANIDIQISGSTSVNEGGTVILSAAIVSGSYDSISYSWTITGAGSISSSTGSSITYTAPELISNTSATIGLTASVTGSGTNAASGTSASETESLTVHVSTIPQAPNRVGIPAGTVAIPSSFTQSGGNFTFTADWDQPVVDVNNDAANSYRWRYRKYDDPNNSGWSDYQYINSASITQASITGIPPGDRVQIQVWARNGSVGSYLYSSFRGTGIRTAPIPNAAAPTITIAADVPSNEILEGATFDFNHTLTGGVYDGTPSVVYTVHSGPGTINSSTGLYAAPSTANDNTSVTVRATVTASGSGTNAASGTSDTDFDADAFNVIKPYASVESVVNAGNTSISEAGTTTITATISGTFDTITNRNLYISAGVGTLSNISHSGNTTTATYTAPELISADTARVRLNASVSGNGTTAHTGSTDFDSGYIDISIATTPQPPNKPASASWIFQSSGNPITHYTGTITWVAGATDVNNDPASGYYYRWINRTQGGGWTHDVPDTGGTVDTTDTSYTNALNSGQLGTLNIGDVVEAQVWAHNAAGRSSLTGTGRITVSG